MNPQQGHLENVVVISEDFTLLGGALVKGAALGSSGSDLDFSSCADFTRCWAFSIYLEAVAILPQLFMLQKQGGAESLTGHYILLLGLYRLFYILNWIYRYATEPHYMQVRAFEHSNAMRVCLTCDNISVSLPSHLPMCTTYTALRQRRNLDRFEEGWVGPHAHGI